MSLDLLNNFPDEFLEEYNKFAPYLLDYNYTLTETEKISVSQKTREYYLAESVDFKSLGRVDNIDVRKTTNNEFILVVWG